MKRRKKRFLRRNKQPEDMALQITSMADIMTIILVFLLKSFSTGASNINPTAGLVLPEAQAASPLEEMLKLEISANAVLIDDKPTTVLRSFSFISGDLESNGTPRSLNAALVAERQKNALRDPASVSAVHMMVMADQKTPYSTLKSVMTAAANNGFGDFKLVVVEDK